MHMEIERKFLVTNEDWRAVATAKQFCQGYLYSASNCLIRIRIEGDDAFLTIKGPKNGISRAEYEYPIPLSEAQELLEKCAHKPLIYKVRHVLPIGKHIWEIDEFCGENTGLFVAEIELHSPDEVFERPQWLGKEVTYDARYRNSALARDPFSQWAAHRKVPF